MDQVERSHLRLLSVLCRVGHILELERGRGGDKMRAQAVASRRSSSKRIGRFRVKTGLRTRVYGSGSRV